MIRNGDDAKRMLANIYGGYDMVTDSVIAECYHVLDRIDTVLLCKKKIKRVFARRDLTENLVKAYNIIWKKLFLED